jgi:cell shape-determining protein MreC
MITEVEYLKFLQQDNSIMQEESSFFKGILNVEKTGLDNQSRIDENLALKEINEQQLKKIQDLDTKVQELEEENRHLGKEHLAILKK